MRGHPAVAAPAGGSDNRIAGHSVDLALCRRCDQVAPDRQLAEDRRNAQPADGGGGMPLAGAALAAALALGLLTAPLAVEAQPAGKVARLGVLLFSTPAADPNLP